MSSLKKKNSTTSHRTDTVDIDLEINLTGNYKFNPETTQNNLIAH